MTPCEQLIQAAWRVKTGMLVGAAGWMESERFDIDAKATEKSTLDEEMVMLRALLADRFQLRFHNEVRQLRMRALVVGKSGPRFQPSKDQNQQERVTTEIPAPTFHSDTS